MAASGGVRADIGEDQHVIIGEDRSIVIDVNQVDGTTAQTMTGWTLAWYLTARAGSAALVTKTPTIGNGDGTDDRATVTLDDASTESAIIAAGPGNYWHELWRIDAGSETRLVYGSFVLQQGVVTT